MRAQPFFMAVVHRRRSSNLQQIQNKRSTRTELCIYGHHQQSSFLQHQINLHSTVNFPDSHAHTCRMHF